MRKKLSHTRMIVLVIAVLLVLSAAIAGVSDTFGKAYAAGYNIYQNGTMLADGQGMKLGNNALRTNGQDGAFSGSGARYDVGLDFYILSSSSYSYSASSLTLQNGSIGTRIKFDTSNMLYSYLANASMGVFLEFTGSIHNSSSQAISVSLKLDWKPNGSTVNQTNTVNVNFNAGQIKPVSVSIENLNSSGLSANAMLEITISTTGTINLIQPMAGGFHNIKTEGTWLSGQGLRFGENKLLTRAETPDGNLDGTGAFNYKSNYFYINNSTSYKYAPNELVLENGSAGVKTRLVSDPLSSWNGVYSAIKDHDMAVSLQFLAAVNNMDSTSRSLTVTVRWYQNGSTLTQEAPAFNYTVPAGGSINSTVEMSNIVSSTALNGNCYFEVTVSSPGKIRLISPQINMSVVSESITIGESVTYKISGDNRKDVTLNTQSSTSSEVAQAYVKTGDIIRLETGAFKGTSFYVFERYYLSIFGLDTGYTGGPSGIVWDNYSAHIESNGQIVNTTVSYLRRVSYGYVDGSESLNGEPSYFIEYQVLDGVFNADILRIDPYIYTSNSHLGPVCSMGSARLPTIDIKVDATKAPIPVIDPTSALGTAILNDKWFTESIKPQITLSSFDVDAMRAKEYVYAFVCDPSVLSLNFDDYDFSPDNGASIIYDGDKVALRQQIILYERVGANLSITRTGCDFYASGEYTLILVVVDGAGNVSTPMVYSKFSGARHNVMVDNTNYSLNVEFLLGTAIVAAGSRVNIAETFYIIGNEYHDSQGNLLNSDPEVYYGPEFRNKTTAKRLQFVTIRIAMTYNKAQDYELISYTNNVNRHNESPVFTLPSDPLTRRRYIDISFEMDDVILDNNGRTFYFYFRERVDIAVNQTVYTFTGSPIDISINVEAYRKGTDTVIQDLDFEYKYYKTLTYVVFPNMAGTTVLNGGRIYLKGQEYINYTQNLILTGQIIEIGGQQYYTIKATVNAKVNNETNYTITAYNVGSYSTTGYIDAGTYWYQVSVDRLKTTRYYGTKEGVLTINRASPNVTGLQAAYPLIYGNEQYGLTGLDLLEYISRGPNNVVYGPADIIRFLDEYYWMSYSGVLGKYVITSPTGEAYYNPNVTSKLTITIEFRPIDVTVNREGNPITDQDIYERFEYYSMFYNEVGSGYELIEGGKHSNNYNVQLLTLDITILPALAEIDITGPREFDYDGEEKSVTITTLPAGLPYTVTYAKKIRDGVYEDFKTALPYNAGEYLVKFIIDSASSNYYSVEKTETIVINKRLVNLTLTDSTPVSAEYPAYNDNGTVYTSYVSYAFGRLEKPPVIAQYTYLGTVYDVNVGYSYSYRKVRDLNNNPVETGYSEPTDFINPAEMEVGTYLYRMTVNNPNNRGEITVMLVITQALYDNNILKLQFPALETEYAVYNIGSNSPRKTGTDSTIGHIEYGQTLEGERERIMRLTAANIGSYLIRGSAERVQVNGRFYFSTEQEVYALNGVAGEWRNGNNQLVLPVLYEKDINGNPTTSVASYMAYIYWEAGEYVDGGFVPDKNYAVAKQLTYIFVARATADFSEVKLSDLIYEQPLMASSFEGSVKASGGVTLSPSQYVLSYNPSPATIYERGDHTVLCTFVPSEELIKNYRNLSDARIPLTVLPKPAGIEFLKNTQNRVAHSFGNNYAPPAVITTPRANLPVVFTYTDLSGNPVIIDSRTPVGLYRVTAVINDDNYYGITESDYYVEKSDLYLYSTPTNPAVFYGAKLSDVILSQGRVRNYTNAYVFDGRFEFVTESSLGGVPLDTVPPVGTSVYRIRFIPDNSEVYNSFNVLYIDYSLTVAKAKATITVGSLEQVYTGAGLSPTYSAQRPDGTPLNISVYFSTPENTLPVNAGQYTVVFRITDVNYEGEIQRTMTIQKAPVTITDPGNVKDYNSLPQRVSYDSSVQGLTFTETYTDYQGFSVTSPTEVGRYFATVTIVDDNYQGTKVIEMNIRPSAPMFEYLNQTYGNLVPVNAIFTPAVSHNVTYRYEGTDEYIPMPVMAGVYYVKVTVEQNGYYDEITKFVDGRDILLQVEKAGANIIADPGYTKTYTSYTHDLGIRSDVIGLRLVYSYKEEGASDDTYTAIAPVNAGRYTVKVVIDDTNYKGWATTLLVITPANLDIRDKPVVTSVNYYSLSKDLVTFAGGYVIFPATGQNVTAQGEFKIGLDDAEYTLLNVGVHILPLWFVPSDARNFNIAESAISVNIYKLDIGSYIRFRENELIQEYNQEQLSVTAYLDNEAFLADTGRGIANIENIKLRVTYNGSQTRPIAVGSYRLGAIIEDFNYTGVAQEATFRVDKADLEVSLPQLSPISVGDFLSESAISGGYAYIRKRSPSDQTKTVAGTFSFTFPDTEMEKANYNKVWLNFTPIDEVNHNSLNFQMDIFVLGLPVTLSDVAATAIVYGQPLSASTLTAESSEPGEIVWTNPNQILNVGEMASYTFIPYNKDVYNIVTGMVGVEVEKAAMSAINVVGKAYVGETLRQARITLDLYHNDHPGEEAWRITSHTLTLLGDDLTLNYVIGVNDPGNNEFFLSVEISHRNYITTEIAVIVTPYRPLTPESFLIGKTSKLYDGQAATVEDFEIELANTQYIVDDFIITGILHEGGSVDAIIDAGVYTVTVAVVDPLYDGSATFTYTVDKKDLSDAIKLAGGGGTVYRVYSEMSGNIELDFFETVDGVTRTYDIDPSIVRFEYFSKDGSISYGAVPPKNAGEYKVRISIAAENMQYKGSAVYNYTVNKKVAEITLPESYSFVYGNAISIVPNISVSGASYILTFNGSNILPENVGKYSVVAHIVHNNYTGSSAPAELTISKAPIKLESAPTLTAITYGQELKNSEIIGGSVSFGPLAIPVSGIFTFVNPERKDYPVGFNSVDVKFTPTNGNYAEYQFVAVLEVKKASGSIEIKSLTATYTGGLLSPSIVTQPLENLAVRYEYIQNNRQVDPIRAGEYIVRMTIIDENYTGSIEAIFTIYKAKAVYVEAPHAGNIAYGQSLEYSALTGGYIKYFGNQTASTAGIFEYVDKGIIPGNAGQSYRVEYRFVATEPFGEDNFEDYYGEVYVTVTKAQARITVSGNNFVYGAQITEPVFTTEPANLNVLNTEFKDSEFFNDPNTQNVGSYQFTAHIDENNYTGSVTYIVSITKKQLTVRFVNSNNSYVDRYTTEYKNVVFAKARIDIGSLVNRDIQYVSEIEKSILYTYRLKGVVGAEQLLVPPKNVGEYEVTASINHRNYYFNAENATVNYKINPGQVTRLEFDTSSLSSQIYGTVSMPIVHVSPSDVQYTISFVGYEFLPKSAGAYSVKVTVTDSNYMPMEKESLFRILPKDITIENIKVSDKAYDGLDSISITGELRGVLNKDEVTLKMTARAEGGATQPGTYGVEILTYEIIGRHASNYRVLEPVYSKKVRIIYKSVTDPATGSYITSQNGFSSNITVDFSEVYDTQNKTNFLTALFGQKATVTVVQIRENGQDAILGSKVKFYVKIPDKYLNVKNLEYGALGALSEQSITFVREGEYVTFYADRSGEVIFYANDFPYWIVIAGGVILTIIIGVVCAFFALPVRRRFKIARGVRKTHGKILKQAEMLEAARQQEHYKRAQWLQKGRL